MTTNSTSQKPSDSSAEPPAGRTRNAIWFWAATIVAITWLLTLAVLAVLTANPITINRAQILSSDALAVGRVTNVSARGIAEIEIEEVLAGGTVPPTIQLARTADVLAVGRTYLLPLQRVSSGWEVTPAPTRAEETYLVYPAGQEVIRHAAELWKSRSERPYP